MNKQNPTTKRTCLVTGACGGLGSAICDLLLERGVSVLMTDKPSDLLISRGSSLGCEVFPADITDREQIAELVKWADSHQVDGLVNNAGVVSQARLIEFPDEDWDRVIDINLTAVHRLTKAIAGSMVEARRAGAIVNVASMSYRGMTQQAAYVASKGGVVSHTKAAALELAKREIRVNAVAPGMIETDMTNPTDGSHDSLRESMVRQIPMGRYGTPKEVASVVAFLLSENASYLTGETIHIAGGARL
ncbi:MAG: SDR family oxidoreductase [Pseudomonadota bacterium]